MRTAFSFSHTWFPYYSFQLPDCSETKFLACLKPEKKFTHASLYTWLVLDDTLVFPQRNDKSRETKNWRCKGLHSGDDRFKSGWGLCIHFRDRVKAPGKSELHWTWSGTLITIRLWDHFTFLGNCSPTPPLNQHFTLRALSICQNWPAGPLPEQLFWQWNRLFPGVFAEEPSPSYTLFRIWLI